MENKKLYKMLYRFGKPILGHSCFKYLKMIFLTNYAYKNGFSNNCVKCFVYFENLFWDINVSNI